MNDIIKFENSDFKILKNGDAYISQLKLSSLTGIPRSTLQDWIKSGTLKGYEKCGDLLEKLIEAGAKAWVYHQAGYEINAVQKFDIPKTLGDALLLAGELAKKNELLEFQAKINQPKIEAYNKIADDDEGVSLSHAAKCLNWGRNKMMEQFRKDKILLKDNTAAQRYVDNGCFKLVIGGMWEHPSTGQMFQNIKTL